MDKCKKVYSATNKEMVIDSVEMTLSLASGKLKLISKWCQKLLQMEEAAIRELSNLLSTLNSTELANFSAPLHVRYLHRKQIEGLVCSKDFQHQNSFGPFIQGGTKLVDNRFKFQQQPISTLKSELVVQSDPSSWGAYCLKVLTKESWSCDEKSLHLNILESRAAKFSDLTFSEGTSNLVVHIQMDNHTALAYLMKLGG